MVIAERAAPRTLRIGDHNVPYLARSLAATALCALLALAAGACSDDPDLQPGPPDGPLGVVEIAEDEPIRIGAMLAFSELPELSRTVADGVRLAIADYGDIFGRAVVLTEPLDSGCSAAAGQDAAREAIADSRLIGVIGTICSSAAIEAALLISDAEMVMISPANTAASLTSDLRGVRGENHHEGYLRVINNDLNEGLALADFVFYELGLRRAAAIRDNDTYHAELTAAFGDAFEALGGELLLVETITRGETDISAALQALAETAPDVVFFPLQPDDALHFMRGARRNAAFEQTVFVTGDVTFTEAFLSVPETDGVYAAGPAFELGGNVNEATGKSMEEALAQYREWFGEPESDLWAYGYDAAALLLSAIEAVAVEDDGALRIGRAALRAALYDRQRFDGLTGALGCDEFGDCGHGKVVIYRHDAGVTDINQLPIVFRYEPWKP